MEFAVDGTHLDKSSRGSGLRFLVNVLMRLGQVLLSALT